MGWSRGCHRAPRFSERGRLVWPPVSVRRGRPSSFFSFGVRRAPTPLFEWLPRQSPPSVLRDDSLSLPLSSSTPSRRLGCQARFQSPHLRRLHPPPSGASFLAVPLPRDGPLRLWPDPVSPRLAASLGDLNPRDYDAILLHAAVNDASKDGPEFEGKLSASCDALGRLAGRFQGCPFLLSTACVSRVDSINIRVRFANGRLRDLARSFGWAIVSNDNVRVQDLSDNVHLNASGTARLQLNFLQALKSLLN